jgi:hypothetical protein
MAGPAGRPLSGSPGSVSGSPGSGSELLQFPLANLALCILFARTAPTGRPLVARLAAEVVALRQTSAAHPDPAGGRFGRLRSWHAGVIEAQDEL